MSSINNDIVIVNVVENVENIVIVENKPFI
jgi:hypothetical protein